MDFNFMTGESGKNSDPLKPLFDLLSPITGLKLEDGKLTLDTAKNAGSRSSDNNQMITPA
ncbi:hypothetical protein A7983_15875 [Pectobacterium wasabiae CFBP 3304]|nr:hypothetical protein A7983_15875 [Pectobacterium wasabiae CFBP 3304]